MLRPTFSLTKEYQVVIYARMSDEMQNPRSPDQQIEEVNRLVKKLNLPWKVVATYRDDGISGRYKRKRPGYQRMIRDLKSRRVQADLILVDTFERLTRAEDADEFRRKLEKNGILVLTVDSGFADPTSRSGRALSKIESIRATEEGWTKAHNVVRGKKDSVRLGYWPGGPVPFGYKLESVMVLRKGVEEIDHRILVPDSQTAPLVRRIYSLATERGWAGVRIFKELKKSKDFPADQLPSSADAVTYILKNEIYKGEYVWGRNCTGVIDDVRLRQEVPEEDWERNAEFCEPIVDPRDWEFVASQRAQRSRPNDDDKSTNLPSAAGIALKYPLSGLVICRHCGRSMNASSSPMYQTKSGEERRYTSYVCTGYLSGVCENSHRVPEKKLRKIVFDILLSQLFLRSDQAA
ncbi:MAG: recombinase family protein [Planctomycetaceae bacterium]|uniref:recombinase family protein n=1 Tax=Thalassoglobus sp. TaxID=2795869 RepID=UPI0019C0CD2F|nr:recombinase family protein [Planctomycetaceae bacterium]